MKISEVFGKAKAVYTARFGDTLKFLLVELCMLAACLTPCLLLFRQELSPWALAAVPLYLLVMLWARMNAACTMQDAMDGASLAACSWRIPRITERSFCMGCPAVCFCCSGASR